MLNTALSFVFLAGISVIGAMVPPPPPGLALVDGAGLGDGGGGLGPEQGVIGGDGDSLRGAIDAVTRRQRELQTMYGPVAAALSPGPPSPGGEYRMNPREAAETLAFLNGEAPPMDGQPENIGYGFQKGFGLTGSGPGFLDNKALERLVLDYLEDREGDPRAREAYILDNKRSWFRERGGAEGPSPAELARARLGRLEAAKRAKHNELIRKMEEPDPEADREYLDLLARLWERYRASNPGVNLENTDASELLEYLASMDGEEQDGGYKEKRQYGGNGYDFFNNAPMLGFRKRNWRVERPNALYSINPEIIKAIRDEELPIDEEDLEELHSLLGPPGVGGPRQQHQHRNENDLKKSELVGLLKRKRYPVSKRSPPPSASNPYKKNQDPVAKELENIFNPAKPANVTKPVAKSATSPPGISTPVPPPTTPAASAATQAHAHAHQQPAAATATTTATEPSQEQPLSLPLGSAYEPIEVKKKSINWNDYFGLDRRKKTGPGDGGRRFFKDHTHFLKRTDTQELNEEEDPNDEMIAKLAAAYSLDKMRQALQMQNQLEQQEGTKRVAIKKELGPEAKEIRNSNPDIPEGYYEPLSEGMMGAPLRVEEDCPGIDQILSACFESSRPAESEFFLPLCRLHQLCYLCGPVIGAPSSRACDTMFVKDARDLCAHSAGLDSPSGILPGAAAADVACERAARRHLTWMREAGREATAVPGGDASRECHAAPCMARLLFAAPARR